MSAGYVPAGTDGRISGALTFSRYRSDLEACESCGRPVFVLVDEHSDRPGLAEVTDIFKDPTPGWLEHTPERCREVRRDR